ncbi:16S rRNA (cytosine(967)-C(5))-methyltransferase RsmB [Aquabacterium sp. OR-4]|uniref:16S rRNA (cytosine(967)-C(5))-methyltransferase RsmB n=1 Tax=Aquabacterium sp. OR-4 TaxID=2978127 RepID=UPI0021B3F8C8|nr:16S rRNA (cytosine(967)-C(5))-methyltransferase RsmB [Aquabacterium sp. OR-4]MDT7834088.1 16S rRNA (cytosine(967)-C(5))-methyltransferase RsmB [Aquabacterium sp. OR-4]
MSAPAPPLSRLLDAVADAVAAVRAGRSLNEPLAACPAELRAGTQALAFHTLRHLGAAQVLRTALAPKAPPPKVDALLLTALALLWPGEAPLPYAAHTLVDQAVGAARKRTPQAAGFVNAVLRRFLREQAALVAAAQARPEALHQHPAWWIERVRADWPDRFAALLAAANRPAPMVLRVNARQGDVPGYLARLAAAGIGARAVHDAATPQAIVLDQPCAVQLLPGFAEGAVSVQDLSAQRAAPLLLGPADGLPALAAGARVLDACAAPGGKTAHLLELADLDLLALDADAGRLARVRDTLARVGRPAALAAADARDTAAWWDGRPFDAILLDAPCTASGIVRRHPDVRWLRRPADVAALARTQAGLLDALWPLLAPGGRLLYATCSLFRDEGSRQIDAFLQRHGASGARLWTGSPGHLLPLPDNEPTPADAPTQGDGFFYALLHKP